MKSFKVLFISTLFFNSISVALSSSFSLVSGINFSVMTYNVENLFDSFHDEGKLDYSYLPLSLKNKSEEVQEYCRSLRNGYYKHRCFTLDWNSEVVSTKIRQLSKVIKRSVNNNSPDILVLQEVENLSVLKQLANEGLKGEGYIETILIEGPDTRGIDVGIISKFPIIGKPKYHEIDLSPAFEPNEKVKLTRGILEAKLSIRGRPVTIMANHWPSQRNSDLTRAIAAQVLIKAIKNIKNPVIVAGDFNTLKDDNPHSINEYMLNTSRRIQFYDIEKVFFGEQGLLYKGLFKKADRGTHHYRGVWSSLDRIFVLKDYLDLTCDFFGRCFKAVWNKYKVIKHPFMLHDQSYQDDSGRDIFYENVPWRFQPETGEGYSDHLPAISTFFIR